MAEHIAAVLEVAGRGLQMVINMKCVKLGPRTVWLLFRQVRACLPGSVQQHYAVTAA